MATALGANDVYSQLIDSERIDPEDSFATYG
jgi:hypothetical protein